MAEDEDVIFENSALCQHLKDVGYTEEDFTAEPVLPNNTSQPPEAMVEVEEPKWKKFLQSFTLAGMKKWYADAISSQNERYSWHVVQIILKSPGLVEDDADFLHHFTDADQQRDPRNHGPDWSFFTAANLFVALVVYLGARLAVAADEIGGWIRGLDLVVGFLLSMYIVPLFVVTFMLYKRRLFWCRFTVLLERYLTRSGEMLLCIKKSVLFIQEMEIISRGFTMVSARSPITRLEQADASSTQRQCPQLRKLIFNLARETMLLHRDATVELYNKYPLRPEVDNVNNYIANITLEEYGPCLTISLDDEDAEEKLQEASDNYSVAALKAICRLCRLQCSEHIRRLAMMHIPDVRLPQTRNIYAVDECVEKGLSRLYEVMRVGALSASRAYDFHRFSSPDPKSRASTPEEDKESQIKRTQRQSVYTAVHSLELHLLSCLKRVRALSEHVEKRSRRCDHLGEYSELQSELSCIQHELSACSSCWEEGRDAVDRLYGVRQAEVPKFSERPAEPESTVEPIDLFEMGDPVQTDQVFEAYSDPHERGEVDYSWDEFLTPEEKAARKREKAEAKRLLLELKSVIDVRAKDREEREKMALLRMTGNGQQTDENQQLPVQEKEVKISETDNSDQIVPENVDEASESSNNVQESQNGELCYHGDGNDGQQASDHSNQDSDEDGYHGDDLHDNDRARLEARWERTCGVDFKFTSNLANLVAARSQELNLQQEMFHDEGEMSDSQSDREDGS